MGEKWALSDTQVQMFIDLVTQDFVEKLRETPVVPVLT
jgi:hypothetical protein